MLRLISIQQCCYCRAWSTYFCTGHVFSFILLSFCKPCSESCQLWLNTSDLKGSDARPSKFSFSGA